MSLFDLAFMRRIGDAITLKLEGDGMNPQNVSKQPAKPLAQFGGYVVKAIERIDNRRIRVTGFDHARTLIFRTCLNGDLDVYEEVTTPSHVEYVREIIPEHYEMRQVVVPASTDLKAVDVV